MASSAAASPVSRRRLSAPPKGESRFEKNLAKILTHATNVFYEKGYVGASMRDLSRSSGMSLGGMYYYLGSKENLLYLIQKHTFSTIVVRLRGRLKDVEEPEERVRVFVHNHLEYFLAHQKAMKVLSHEDDALKNGYGSEIAAIKRDYYHTCIELMDNYKRAKGLDFSSRVAVLSLFGMMNWIYTWYNPRVDGDAEELAQAMGDIFLQGLGNKAAKPSRKKRPAVN